LKDFTNTVLGNAKAPANTGAFTRVKTSRRLHESALIWILNYALPVTNSESRCGNKYVSSYIGEQFGENRVGEKWLMGAGLRIPLTLSERGRGLVGR
jgi:hypothetical protein